MEVDLLPKLRIGDKAPDFNLPSNRGENIALSQFIGKRSTVIFFYPMDESPVCSKEAEAFRDKHEAFKKLNAEVVGISSQSVQSHQSFANRHNLPFILLSDSDGNVKKRYGVPTTLGVVPGRVTYVIDKDGVIGAIFSSQLHPARHADEALIALSRIASRG